MCRTASASAAPRLVGSLADDRRPAPWLPPRQGRADLLEFSRFSRLAPAPATGNQRGEPREAGEAAELEEIALGLAGAAPPCWLAIGSQGADQPRSSRSTEAVRHKRGCWRRRGIGLGDLAAQARA